MNTVLVIAGYDPSGGAGILADIKAIAAAGCYGVAAITSVTFQNTLGVFGAEQMSRESLENQTRPLLDDFEIAAVKTGMLPSAELIEATADLLKTVPTAPLVVDPVIRSTSGFDLVDDRAVAVLVKRLFPLASLVTPNAVEAQRITGMRIANEDDLAEASRRLVRLGARAALVKGGHLDLGGMAVDVLAYEDRLVRFAAPRVESRNTHGTGCTLASTIAANLALGHSLERSVETAKAYVTTAIERAPGLGRGHGPLDHFWMLAG
jgi:hydroxymethylpyrimidine/phosphomethylpyrimidine kinase